MNKKGDLAIETIGKILIGLGLLVVLLIIIGLFSGKSFEVFDAIKDIFSFGR